MKERLLAATRTVEDRNARPAWALMPAAGPVAGAVADGLGETSHRVSPLGEFAGTRPGRECAKPQGAAARVLDQLLIAADGGPVRAALLAAATPLESAELAVESIAEAASARGRRVLVARLRCLADDRAVIEWPIVAFPDPDVDGGEGEGDAKVQAIRFGLYARPRIPELVRWLESATRRYDLVLLQGPSLDQSRASAVVGAACDGLLLLADAAATTARQLRQAIDTTQAAGCHVFGVFVDEGGVRPAVPLYRH